MRLDKRILLSNFNQNLQEKNAAGRADFQCPTFTMRQANEIYKRHGLNTARSIFKSSTVTYERYGDQRDLTHADILPRWENPEEYTPTGSELLVPYRFAQDHFLTADIDLIKSAIEGLTSQINACIVLYDDTLTALYPHYINVKRYDENFAVDTGYSSIFRGSLNYFEKY
jgi:hypothetical protein